MWTELGRKDPMKPEVNTHLVLLIFQVVCKHNGSYFESPNMYSVLIIEMSVFINMNLDAYISINHCKLYTKIWACLLSENTSLLSGSCCSIKYSLQCFVYCFLFFCYDMSFNCYFFNVFISSNYMHWYVQILADVSFISFISLIFFRCSTMWRQLESVSTQGIIW